MKWSRQILARVLTVLFWIIVLGGLAVWAVSTAEEISIYEPPDW